MRIHYLQHVPFETPGSIEAWATENGHAISGTAVYTGAAIPPVETMDYKRHPWLVGEKQFITGAIEKGKVVIGVCLGAQLVAGVLGARVMPNRHKEIGWHPIEITDAGRRSYFATDSPHELDAFHWHRDTFDLPRGSERLARSEVCENQIFAFGDRVVALQCHLEMTREIASKLVDGCPDDVGSGPYAQTAEEILESPERFDRLHAPMTGLLSRLARIPVG